MFCGKCGTENPDDSKYCLKCGADLEKMKTPPPGVRKSIGEMKTVLSDEDIALLFDKGTLINDRYEIKALLGKGGMGVVYQVYDRLLREEAALKMMLPSLMMQKRAEERFIQEARISMHLSHENIVRVRDIGEFQSLRYIFMEYVKGVTLRQLIDKKQRKGEAFSLEECWKIVIQIVEGLLYAHKRTVHRDIKPENIIITPEGLVKITDFGIAKAIDPTRFTSSSTSLGTAYYMAPEQTKASAEVDPRADIYSVGVIIYELLTGAIPMGSFESPHSINPQIPEEMDAIIVRALKPIPEERYQSIAELKEELEEIGKTYLVSEMREHIKLKKLTKLPIIDTNFIRCINCHANNPYDREFCYHCGANLKIACPKCKGDTRVDLTYCGECGANILEAKERKIGELEAKAKGYIKAKIYKKAIKEIEAIAELDRKHPLIYQLREGIEKKKEQVRKAKELVQKASVLLKEEKYQEAVDVAKSALELDRAILGAQHIHEEALSKIRYIEALHEIEHKQISAYHPWAMFRHDPQHTGRSHYEGPLEPLLKWTFSTRRSICASPAIGSDGTIYIGSNDKNLYAINPNGRLKWQYKTRGKIVSSLAIGVDGTIYVGSWDKNLYAINPDGSKKWKYETGGKVYSSPAIGADGTIYVGSWDKNLYAINLDGSMKWEFYTVYTRSWVESSPAIGTNGTIYVESHEHKLYAINPDGSQKWKFDTRAYIRSSPAIGADGTIYVGSYDGKLYAIKSDGSMKWEFATGGRVTSSPAIGWDGTIYVGSHDHRLYAINPDGSQKWEFATGDDVESSPAIGADGTIYVGSDDGKLYAIGEK